jgi:hypothetical protein
MKMKIIVMLVITLLITTAIPAMGLIEENNYDISFIKIEEIFPCNNFENQLSDSFDQVDQQQTQYDYSRNIGDSSLKLAQSFKPSDPTLTKFRIRLQKDSGTPEFANYVIRLYAGQPGGIAFILWETVLSGGSISTGANWYEFNNPDKTVTPDTYHYIEIYGVSPTIFTTNVRWCYGVSTPYARGSAYWYDGGVYKLLSFLGSPCDYCFKTYAPGTGNNPPDTPSKPSGATSVIEGVQYTYTTSTDDPDGDQVKYGFDFDNDGIIQSGHWTGFYSSGSTCYLQITFYGLSTRYIRAKAEDEHGAQSGFSSALTVTVSGGNNPPDTPSTPSGPSTGSVGTSYTYSSSTDDPDGDQVKYYFDWEDGPGDWTSLVASGTPGSASHTWNSAGTYNVKVKAEDEHGAQSSFSSVYTVTITDNSPPDQPDKPSGDTSGKAGTSHTYSTSTDDPDGDQIWYKWDWGDIISDWDGPYNSGDPVITSHMWSNQGTYAVKVKAKDDPNGDGDLSDGLESIWSDPLNVNMPKIKIINTPFIEFLKNHLYLFPLLQRILDL